MTLQNNEVGLKEFAKSRAHLNQGKRLRTLKIILNPLFGLYKLVHN